MQVISFMAIKGGVGKTTMAFQFAKYLQENNKSTLLIDLDSQKSLTGTFETKDFNFKDKHNISEILSNPQIGIIATTVEKNIDVIPSTSNLEEIADNLATKPNKELLLFMWFVKNSKELNQKYDYIILDLPPAWNLLTKNGVAVADKVISPMEPSRFGYESHTKVLQSVSTLKNEVVDPVSGKSDVSAKIYFLGNRVKHNTNSSKEFLEALKNINDVIGIVPEKEAINTSMLLKKGIFDYLEETGQTHTQNKFIASLKKVFNQIETKGIE